MKPVYRSTMETIPQGLARREAPSEAKLPLIKPLNRAANMARAHNQEINIAVFIISLPIW
jgi:hypothetical protein